MISSSYAVWNCGLGSYGECYSELLPIHFFSETLKRIYHTPTPELPDPERLAVAFAINWKEVPFTVALALWRMSFYPCDRDFSHNHIDVVLR